MAGVFDVVRPAISFTLLSPGKPSQAEKTIRQPQILNLFSCSFPQY